MHRNIQNIKKEISFGEDSFRQFKAKIDSASRLAEEMCAMSNSRGGIIYVGVQDNNTITGLSQQEITHYNQYISNGSNEIIKPSIHPQTRIVEVNGKLILLINISEGPAKPYCVDEDIYWVRSGSNKGKTSPRELLLMFQQSSITNLDKSFTSAEINSGEIGAVINLAKFYIFYERSRGSEFSLSGITVQKAFENMNLAREGKLTLAGLLLFANNPQSVKPFCIIRTVSYFGTEISDDRFKDRVDCLGVLDDQYRGAMNFLKNNLTNRQAEGSFNQTGNLEINERALEEAIVNALLHRDYSKNAVIRLLIFKDRVEIISPGSLPNHLSIENILNGNSIIRNPTIVSYATKILPYSGIGSGIPRIIKNHPATKFVNDTDGEQFTITLYRP